MVYPEDGTFVLFHENKRLKEEGEVRNGRLVGVHRKWNHNGTLIYECDFKDGKSDITVARFDYAKQKWFKHMYRFNGQTDEFIQPTTAEEEQLVIPSNVDGVAHEIIIRRHMGNIVCEVFDSWTWKQQIRTLIEKKYAAGTYDTIEFIEYRYGRKCAHGKYTRNFLMTGLWRFYTKGVMVGSMEFDDNKRNGVSVWKMRMRDEWRARRYDLNLTGDTGDTMFFNGCQPYIPPERLCSSETPQIDDLLIRDNECLTCDGMDEIHLHPDPEVEKCLKDEYEKVTNEMRAILKQGGFQDSLDQSFWACTYSKDGPAYEIDNRGHIIKSHGNVAYVFNYGYLSDIANSHFRKSWFPNGVVSIISRFDEHGCSVGTSRSWFEDGHPKRIMSPLFSRMQDGKEWERNDVDGSYRLIHSCVYDHEKKRHIKTYITGYTHHREEFVKGQRHGLAETWEYMPDDGKSLVWRTETMYAWDQKDGYARTWDGSGQLRAEEFFKEGCPVGIWRTWTAEGALYSEIDKEMKSECRITDECLIYHRQIEPGEKYLKCRYGHPVTYSAMMNFQQRSHQSTNLSDIKCIYCMNPIIPTIFTQPTI